MTSGQYWQIYIKPINIHMASGQYWQIYIKPMYILVLSPGLAPIINILAPLTPKRYNAYKNV